MKTNYKERNKRELPIQFTDKLAIKGSYRKLKQSFAALLLVLYVCLPARNGLVNEDEFLGFIPQNGGRAMTLQDC